MAGIMADFQGAPSLAALEQDTEALMAEIDGTTDLPRVMRSLGQLRNDGEQLWSRVTESAPSREQAEVQASILLGSRGIDLPKLSHRIDTLPTAQSFGPVETIPPWDTEGFLKSQRQNGLLSLIADIAKDTQEELGSFLIRAQKDRWESDKRKVLSSIEVSADTSAERRLQSFNDSLNVYGSSASASFLAGGGRSLLSGGGGASLLGGAVGGSGAPSRLSAEEMRYARALAEHNAAILSGGGGHLSQHMGGGGTVIDSLVDRLATVADQLELNEVARLWHLLQDMQVQAATGHGGHSSLATGNASAGGGGRLPLAHAARRFLEKKHLTDLRHTVYGNLNRASLGGVPGTAQLIRAYLNIKPVPPAFPDEPLVDGHPLWVVLYHALRCGDLACAKDVAMKAGLADFAGKFQEAARYPRQGLSSASVAELRMRYSRELGMGASCGNPFQRVVMAVLAGCDVANDHAGAVGDQVEDFLWIHLCKVLSRGGQPTTMPAMMFSSVSSDHMTLGDLQRRLANESLFEVYQRPLQYAYVLLLSAQFELAVEFLYRVEAHRCLAVHMAVALSQIGLLQDASHPQAPLLTRDEQQASSDDDNASAASARLNLVRLITSYTRRFETAEPDVALEYYFALKDGHPSLWLQCVTELVLETGQFDRLLGKRQPDGGITRGSLDKFVSDGGAGALSMLGVGGGGGERAQLAAIVAEAAEARGLNEEAVSLFDLADQRDRCVQLLGKLLSHQVTQAGPEGSKRAKLQKIAHQVTTRYPSPDLNLLIDLMNFFDLYYASKNNEALELVRRLGLVPLSMDDLDAMINVFCGVTEQVRRVIPDLLMTIMTILAEQYKAIKRPASQRSMLSLIPLLGGGSDTKLELIKRQANAVIKYAGMVPYRIPANVNARLVQMEANMA